MKKKLFAPSALTVLLLSFLVPIAVLFAVYSTFGIYPFGDKSLLIMDLSAQSVDFYAYIRDLLTGDSNLIYSFSKGLGGNVISLLSYYGALPFTLLSALFPKENMQEAVFFINCFLVGLSGLSMCIFLHSQKKEWDYSLTVFSVSYALMTYSVIYSMQMQWLCGVLFLPLIILGINRMVEEGKWGTFVLFYTLLLLSNIYTGYMVTVFSGIYYFWKNLSEKKNPFGKSFLTFMAAGVGSFALSAFWTLPAFLSTMAGREGMAASSPDITVSYGLKNIFMKFFMGQYDSITNTLPQSAGTISLYCGVLILVLALSYFLSKAVSLREKVCSGIVLLIFGLSIPFVALDKVWHLFSYPNWFPYRWAFLIPFFLVFLAHRALTAEKKVIKKIKKDSSKTGHIFAAFGILLVILAILFGLNQEKFPNTSLAAATFIFLILYMILLWVRPRFPQTVSLFLIIFVCVELGLSGLSVMHGLNRQFGYKPREDYIRSVSAMEAAVDSLEDAPFYRVEKTDLRSDNDPMNVGYFGMSHYSSSFDKDYKNIDYNLGMIQEWYACRYSGATPVVDSIFGVKYVLSTFPPTDSYQVFSKTEKYTVYENPWAMPLGFVVNGDVKTAPAYTQNFLENQNLLYRALTGEDVFAPILAEDTENGILFTITEEKPVYLALSSKLSNLTVLCNGQEIPVRDTWETKIKLLGTFSVGDQITVILPDDGNTASFAYLDEDVLSKHAEKFQKNGLTVTDFGNTRIKGSINAPTGGTLVTTIPFDEGWSVKIDGKKAEPFRALDTFLAVPMEAGEHEVLLTYRAPGMMAGVVLSILALAVLIFLKKKRA